MCVTPLSRWLLTCLLVVAAPGLAQAANLKIDQVSAVPYTSLVLLHNSQSRPTGVVEEHVAPPGMVYWLVTYRVAPEWDETTESMDIDDETYGLYDGTKRLEHIGGMNTFGVLDRYLSAPYLYRSDDWKTRPADAQWRRFVAIVPDKTQEALLRLENVVYSEENPDAPPKKTPYSAPVKVAGKPKAFDVNDFVEVRVRAVKMLEYLEEKNEYNRQERPRRLVNQGGSILQLTLQITPKAANTLEGKVFSWDPGEVGLSFGKGGRAVCLGTRQGGSISDYVDGIELTDGEIWDSRTIALYFPVPSNLRSFEITFLGQKVADAVVPAGP